MRRLDWNLIRPLRPTRQASSWRTRLARLDVLEDAIGQRLETASVRYLSEPEVDELADLEERYEALTMSPCEAAHAPRIGDDPDWELRAIEEFERLDLDLEIEEYLEQRRQDFDCERCPFATGFSLYPQDPCELSVGPLLDALEDEGLRAALSEPMGPDDMRALADKLRLIRQERGYLEVLGLDIDALLVATVDFLDRWAPRGFGVRPELAPAERPLMVPHDAHTPWTPATRGRLN